MYRPNACRSRDVIGSRYHLGPCRRRQFSCHFLDRSERARRDGGSRGDQREARRARAGDGRDVHRRAWHRHRQAGMAGRRAGRRGRADADDQARARSAEFAQPRQDLRAVMAAQAEPLASSNARLTAPATLVPLLLLALVATMGFTALGSFRSEEHTSELQSLMRISYAVFFLTNKNYHIQDEL